MQKYFYHVNLPIKFSLCQNTGGQGSRKQLKPVCRPELTGNAKEFKNASGSA
jgi:hypothetical protein